MNGWWMEALTSFPDLQTIATEKYRNDNFKARSLESMASFTFKMRKLNFSVERLRNRAQCSRPRIASVTSPFLVRGVARDGRRKGWRERTVWALF